MMYDADENEHRAGRLFESADEVLSEAVHYWLDGGDVVGRLLPDEVQNPSPLIGLQIPHRVALFVEETPLFEEAKLMVWIAYRRRSQPAEGDVPQILARFLKNVEARLPEVFHAPQAPRAKIDVERELASDDAARQSKIDEKYRLRYPGLMRPGFRASWEEGERRKREERAA